MSSKIDVLAQVTLKEGSDNRRKTFTLSDQTVVESSFQQLQVPASTNAVQVRFPAIASTKSKILFVSSDRIIKINYVTRSGAVDLSTGKTNGFGDVVAANGFFLICGTGNFTTSIWVTNKASTAANVQVGVYAKTSA